MQLPPCKRLRHCRFCGVAWHRVLQQLFFAFRVKYMAPDMRNLSLLAYLSSMVERCQERSNAVSATELDRVSYVQQNINFVCFFISLTN